MKTTFFRKTIQILPDLFTSKQDKIVPLSIKSLPSVNFLNDNILNNHPSVIEAEKLLKSLEKDYKKRITEVCRLGEQRLQSFKKEKIQRILNIENGIQNNLKIAQEIAAKPREKAEQNLAKIESKNYSNPLLALFKRFQEKIAKYQLKKAKDKEVRIIDAAFEKNHLLRDEGKLKIKEDEEKLDRQILQETENQRIKELSRFKNLRSKINFLVQVLQNSHHIAEVSIL